MKNSIAVVRLNSIIEFDQSTHGQLSGQSGDDLFKAKMLGPFVPK